MRRTGNLRIGIIAHEFLVNIGANDFLKNVLRGLALQRTTEVYFFIPRSNELIEQNAPQALKQRLKEVPGAKRALRAMTRPIGPVTDLLMRNRTDEHSFYAEACPWMEIISCEATVPSLRDIMEVLEIDLVMPSIHILPPDIPHVNYWPDCQPKHFPEFFDDASQKDRDDRILGLLQTGAPMIINSRSAKADMEKFYNANPDQIFDLPFAPIVEFSTHTPKPELLNSYSLPRPYFIVCNQFWIHKSIETVIDAAAIAKEQGLNVDIVFTGKMEEPRKFGYIESLRARIKDRNVEDRIILLGYIPKVDQLELMRRAIAVIQPTLFEGGPGGGSIYDAVAMGVRGIVSDIPINHELPLAPGSLETFRTRDSEDLALKMKEFYWARYTQPSPEDLYQLSKRSTQLLSDRLYEAIQYALESNGAIRQ